MIKTYLLFYTTGTQAQRIMMRIQAADLDQANLRGHEYLTRKHGTDFKISNNALEALWIVDFIEIIASESELGVSVDDTAPALLIEYRNRINTIFEKRGLVELGCMIQGLSLLTYRKTMLQP